MADPLHTKPEVSNMDVVLLNTVCSTIKLNLKLRNLKNQLAS